MTTEPIQNPLFDDPLGITLKHARQRKELSIEAAARQLRLPVAVVDAMEREAWQTLGAPIYVKSYLGSYLKLLGLPESMVSDVRTQRTDPSLVAMTPVSKVQRTLHRSWRRISYMVMTGVLVGSVAMLAVHLQSRGAGSAEPISLGAPLDIAATASSDPRNAAVQESFAPGVAAGDDMAAVDVQAPPPAAVAASLAPLPAVDGQAGLFLRFRGESWVDIIDGNGQRIERGMVAIGTEKSFPVGSISRLTLGNASMVDVLQGGNPVDLGPYLSEDVARFGVSSDGRVTAPGG